MRTDMISMNPGKAVAQGAHAANQCIFEAELKTGDPIQNLVVEWENQTKKGFGTTITLGVSEKEMRAAVMVAQAMGIHSNITHDPTYPLIDGEIVHLLPLDTCAYVFGRKEDLRFILGNFKLMD